MAPRLVLGYGAADPARDSLTLRTFSAPAQEAIKRPDYRLFFELRTADDGVAPDWIQVLPKPATYLHPWWDEMTITDERIENFVANVNNQVYQDRLPVDADHETKLGGAYGWILEARVMTDDDGAVIGGEARVEWTKRGMAMFEDGRFRYISPEWFEEWQDPATGLIYSDVLIAAALTNRPFFKNMRPVLANERGVYAVQEEGDAWLIERVTVHTAADPATPPAQDPPATRPTQASEPERSTPVADDKPTTVTVQMSQDVQRQLDELSTKLDTVSQQYGEMVSERDTLKQMNEKLSVALDTSNTRIATLEREALVKRYTDEVTGVANDGQMWFGDPKEHVDSLLEMHDKLGADSPILERYIQQQRAIAAQVHTTTLKPRGSDRAGADNVVSQFNAMVNERVKEARLSFSEALAQVAQENPALYERYRQASQIKV